MTALRADTPLERDCVVPQHLETSISSRHIKPAWEKPALPSLSFPPPKNPKPPKAPPRKRQVTKTDMGNYVLDSEMENLREFFSEEPSVNKFIQEVSDRTQPPINKQNMFENHGVEGKFPLCARKKVPPLGLKDKKVDHHDNNSNKPNSRPGSAHHHLNKQAEKGEKKEISRTIRVPKLNLSSLCDDDARPAVFSPEPFIPDFDNKKFTSITERLSMGTAKHSLVPLKKKTDFSEIQIFHLDGSYKCFSVPGIGEVTVTDDHDGWIMISILNIRKKGRKPKRTQSKVREVIYEICLGLLGRAREGDLVHEPLVKFSEILNMLGPRKMPSHFSDFLSQGEKMLEMIQH